MIHDEQRHQTFSLRIYVRLIINETFYLHYSLKSLQQ